MTAAITWPDGRRFAYVEDETTVRVWSLDDPAIWTTLDAPVPGSLTW